MNCMQLKKGRVRGRDREGDRREGERKREGQHRYVRERSRGLETCRDALVHACVKKSKHASTRQRRKSDGRKYLRE